MRETRALERLRATWQPARSTGRVSQLAAVGMALVAAGGPATAAQAHSSHSAGSRPALVSEHEALHEAFPSADRIEKRMFFVTEEQAIEAEQLAHTSLDSRLRTFWVASQGTNVLGYATVDSHVVRTLEQVIMVALDPSGVVRRVDLLAFHERHDRPVDATWMRQFTGKRLADQLTLGRDLKRPARRMLSAKAATAAVRRVLALHHVLLAEDPA